MGIDATKPLGEKAHFYEMAVIPGFEGKIDIQEIFPRNEKINKGGNRV